MLMVFVSVGLIGLEILNIINNGLVEYEKRYLEQGSQNLSEMFIFIEGRHLLLLTVLVAALSSALGFVVFNWFVGVMLGGMGFLLPRTIINKIRERRIRTFDRQLVDALVQMSSAFRAGLTLGQAVESISNEMQPPISQEFGLFLKEVKLGVGQEEALLNLSSRVDSENLLLVVTATNVSRKLGGNLAEMYDTISTTIRDRFESEGKVRALTSMGRMQAWVVGSMPLVMGLAFYFMRPDLMDPMLNSTFGVVLIGFIIILEIIGMFLIRRIVDIDV